MAKIEDIGSQRSLPRPPLTEPNGEGPLPWLTLPTELKIKIMRQFVPYSMCCTEYKISKFGQTVRPDNEPWASRQALAAACLASRQLHIICRPLLYEAVALRNDEEVMCFLRSLVGSPELRALVRRLAWVDLVRVGKNTRNGRWEKIGRRLGGSKAVDTLSYWPIDSPDRRLAEIFQLSVRESPFPAFQKALAAVLAMLPRIEALFLTHGSSGWYFLGPSYSTRQHHVTRLLSPPLQSLSTLEEINVDLRDTPWTLWYLILNCPRLRRVALKGRVIFRAEMGLMEWENNHLNSVGVQFQRPLEIPSLSRVDASNVQELFLYDSDRVKWDLLPMIFPDLERLVTVFADNGWRDAFWERLSGPRSPVRLSEELGQVIDRYKSSLRSLTVTDFLSMNEWTKRDRHWMRYGQYSGTSLTFIAPIPPLLSPGLPQVPLVELMTDCVWLFGRDDPSVAYQISSLLPSSLVSLHLIDYWAVPVEEEGVRMACRSGSTVREARTGPRGRDIVLSYYPLFPSGLTPLTFLENVFAILRDSCAGQHARLKDITLSSPMFDQTGRWSETAVRPVDRAEVLAWQARVGDTFAKVGVRFSFTTMKGLRKIVESSWVHM